MWDIIKQLISTRGLQLIMRYIGTGLFSLAAWCGATVSNEDGQKATLVISTIVIALICKGVDLFSHWLQTKNKELEVDQERELGRRIGLSEAKDTNRILPLILLCLLPVFCSGCQAMKAVDAAVASAVTNALTHVDFTVDLDPATGHVVAHVTFRDASGNVIETRDMSVPEMESACLRCNDQAQKQLKATYKRAIQEMQDTEKRELATLKAARAQCHKPPAKPPAPPAITFVQPAPVELQVPSPTIPQPGDEVVPATNADGSFSIPGEKGLWKVMSQEPRPQGSARQSDPHQCQIINGKKVCR